MVRQVADMERLKNMSRAPAEIRSDWRREFSSKGPRTNANIRVGRSYPNFLNVYPLMPNKSITRTSNRLLLML